MSCWASMPGNKAFVYNASGAAGTRLLSRKQTARTLVDGAETESAAYEAGAWALSRAAAATPARAIRMTLRRDSCACTVRR